MRVVAGRSVPGHWYFEAGGVGRLPQLTVLFVTRLAVNRTLPKHSFLCSGFRVLDAAGFRQDSFPDPSRRNAARQ